MFHMTRHGDIADLLRSFDAGQMDRVAEQRGFVADLDEWCRSPVMQVDVGDDFVERRHDVRRVSGAGSPWRRASRHCRAARSGVRSGRSRWRARRPRRCVPSVHREGCCRDCENSPRLSPNGFNSGPGATPNSRSRSGTTHIGAIRISPFCGKGNWGVFLLGILGHLCLMSVVELSIICRELSFNESCVRHRMQMRVTRLLDRIAGGNAVTRLSCALRMTSCSGAIRKIQRSTEGWR